MRRVPSIAALCALIVGALPGIAAALEGAATGTTATAAAGTAAVGDPLGSESLLRLAGGMLLVLALVFVVAWLLRRLQRLQGLRPGAMRVVAGLAVGQRERLLVVQVGDEQLLIGVAQGRVEKLHQLAVPLEAATASSARGGFAGELRRLLGEQARERGDGHGGGA